MCTSAGLVGLVTACAGASPAETTAAGASRPVASAAAPVPPPPPPGPAAAPEAASATSPSGAGASPAVAQGQRGQVIPPDLGDVEHMCALLTSCDKLPIPPSLIPPDFSACVTKMAAELSSPSAVGFSLLMRECGLQANSCASLRSCALRGASPDACAGRGKQAVVGFCDVDGRALACWHEQPLAVRDCPRGGEQCVVVEGQATCTLGACPSGIQEGDKPRCSGSGRHLIQCQKGKLASLDCAAFGLRCATDADGTAGCATAGAPCAPGAKRCDGNAAIGCYDGREVRVDCAAGGMTCAPSTGATPVGACFSPAPAPIDACDLGDHGKCEGANLKYCYAGRPRVYPCKALGFNRCEAVTGGVHCAP